MRLHIFTAFLIAFFCFAVTTSYSQMATDQPDKYAEFTKGPSDLGFFEVDEIEEVVGTSDNVFGPSGSRGRGNIFECTTERRLLEHRLYLNLTASSTVWFCVYEGSAPTGIFNLVSGVDVSPQGPGEGWYSSGPIDITLTPGNHYLIFAQWDNSANYYNEQDITPYPDPVSFGGVTAGAGWNWVPTYAVPPPNTQDVTSVAYGDPVAYYQTLVTEDPVPVELTSFTSLVSDNNVTLRWSTATETNNNGFEVQRQNGNGTWNVVGFIEGNGTTTETSSYSFVDENLDAGKYTYRLKQIDYDGTFEYSFEVNAEVKIPLSFSLSQNYPNPFNPSTKIEFQLKENTKVDLKVYNVLGVEVATLVNSELPAGIHAVNFDASKLSSGIYYYRIEAGSFTDVKKMTLMK